MSAPDEPLATAIARALEEAESENPRLRSAAVERLGRMGAGLPQLIHAASDRNGYVRAAAAEALGNFSPDEVALPLGDLLFDDNPFVRSAAARSLGRVRALDYADSLLEMLDDANPHIRAAAMSADAKSGSAAQRAVNPGSESADSISSSSRVASIG